MQVFESTENFLTLAKFGNVKSRYKKALLKRRHSCLLVISYIMTNWIRRSTMSAFAIPELRAKVDCTIVND